MTEHNRMLRDSLAERLGYEAKCEGAGGVAVLVDGAVVAWFADFNDPARDWCTNNHFGRWLVWRASVPEIIPLTPEEMADCDRRADALMAKVVM